MTDPVVFWPGVLGISFRVVGIITYRRDFQAASREAFDAFGLTAFGPIFVAASLAAFADAAVEGALAKLQHASGSENFLVQLVKHTREINNSLEHILRHYCQRAIQS